MLQKLMDYEPAKGAEYATYIYPFIRDAMLRFRMGEEKWSVSSLTNYKMVRSMAWLYHNTKDAVSEFAKKYNCDLALAEEYLKVVRGIRNQQPFYVTDEDGEETGEDVALYDSWNYTDILWNGIQAEKVQRAFEKLNYREQTLLEKRLAICMTCGRVSSWKDRPTFEELAVMFEGSTASGAETSLPQSSGQADGTVGCRRCAPCCPVETGVQNQAKKENRRRNLRISSRLRRRMGRNIIGFRERYSRDHPTC